MPDQTTVTSSSQFALNWRDLVRGTIVAAIGAVVGILLGMLQAEDVVINLTKLWQGAAIAGLSYLAKNYFDPPKIVITNPTKNEVKAVSEGTAEAVIKTKEPPISYTHPSEK